MSTNDEKKKTNPKHEVFLVYFMHLHMFIVKENERKLVIICFTVVDVSAARSEELPLCDSVKECLLFRYDVCVMPFCR